MTLAVNLPAKSALSGPCGTKARRRERTCSVLPGSTAMIASRVIRVPGISEVIVSLLPLPCCASGLELDPADAESFGFLLLGEIGTELKQLDALQFLIEEVNGLLSGHLLLSRCI